VASAVAVGIDLVGLWPGAAEGHAAVAVRGRCHGDEIVSAAGAEASATSVGGRAGWAGWAGRGRIGRHDVLWSETTIFQSSQRRVPQRCCCWLGRKSALQGSKVVRCTPGAAIDDYDEVAAG